MNTATIDKLKRISGSLADPELTTRLFEDAPDAVIVVDHEGMIKLVNRQAEFLFSYHRSELYDNPVEMLMPEAVRDVHKQHRINYMNEPHPRSLGVGIPGLKGLTKFGVEFEAEISLNPIVTQSGSFVAAIVRKKRQ